MVVQMFSKLKVLLIIGFVSLSFQAFAWWDSSHMVIVQIAEENLSEKTKEETGKLINLLNKNYPECCDFVTSATWADDVASSGFTGWAWHGKSLPYDPDNILSKNQKDIIEASLKENVLIGIEQAIKTLKNPDANEYTKALMLGFLIHIVGDIHMPLHCTSLYSKDFPNGDYGGGKFNLDIDLNGKNSLHALWDSCLTRDYKRLKKPLDEEGIKYLNDFKQEILSLYPKNNIDELDEKDFNKWILESHKIGSENAYHGININEKPSNEYIEQNKIIAYRQIAKAGYRLADILNSIYENNN